MTTWSTVNYFNKRCGGKAQGHSPTEGWRMVELQENRPFHKRHKLREVTDERHVLNYLATLTPEVNYLLMNMILKALSLPVSSSERENTMKSPFLL